MDWKLAGYVAAGGVAGCLARYAVSGVANRGDFPYGTLLVNVGGCFVVGLLYFGGLAGGWLSPEVRAVALVGFLGGFTTMSSFAVETMAFMEEGALRSAAAYFALTLAGSFVGVWLGRIVGLSIWRGA